MTAIQQEYNKLQETIRHNKAMEAVDVGQLEATKEKNRIASREAAASELRAETDAKYAWTKGLGNVLGGVGSFTGGVAKLFSI